MTAQAMRRNAALALAVIGIASATASARQLTDAYASPGPYAVTDPIDFTIPHSGGELPLRARFPMGDESFPLIVFSHSLGGDRTAFEPVVAHWASHGYAVVRPSHDDSGVRMTERGLHPPEEKIRERLGNVIAVLDGLDRIDSVAPAGGIDRDRLAVAGHSYGSFISMVAGGITIAIGNDPAANLGDDRVRCVLPVSPSGRGDYGMGEGSYNSLTRPAMFFAGTNDIRNGRREDWRLEPYRLSPAGDKYLVVIDRATHNAYGGDRGPGDAPTYVKAASTAFWDACLKGRNGGYRYLAGEDGFRGFAGAAATLRLK